MISHREKWFFTIFAAYKANYDLIVSKIIVYPLQTSKLESGIASALFVTMIWFLWEFRIKRNDVSKS